MPGRLVSATSTDRRHSAVGRLRPIWAPTRYTEAAREQPPEGTEPGQIKIKDFTAHGTHVYPRVA
jgi:hypothetical protein